MEITMGIILVWFWMFLQYMLYDLLTSEKTGSILSERERLAKKIGEWILKIRGL